MQLHDGPHLLEGFLSKRGPTKQFKWQRRWCVLSPTCLVYYEDSSAVTRSVTRGSILSTSEDGKRQCGKLEIKPSTRAIPFGALGAPGDSAKYINERPFGFCFDTSPDDGPSRRLYYFDAETREALKAWSRAIDEAVATLAKLCAGDIVTVLYPFQADSASEVALQSGETGTVVSLDEEGDALIDFHHHNLQLWVYSNKFRHLKKEMEPHEKYVSLELIPQDAFIVHWAVRVGTGPTSVCYEFEASGVEIGRRTKLDKGFPMKVQRLNGCTYKTHEEIRAWALKYGETHQYSLDGSTFGGGNCQDFSVHLCKFLGVDTGQLPWTQASQVKAVLGAGALAADVAMGAGFVAAGADMVMTAGAAAAGVALAPEFLAVAGGAAVVGYACGMFDDPDNDATAPSKNTKSVGKKR